MAANNAPSEKREPPRMRRRWFVNLALLVVVLALVAFYLYYREQEKTEAGPVLTAIATQQIARVQIERPGQSTIVLEKHGNEWRLTAPLAARANRFTVENLLAVAGARSELKLDGGEPRQYGLETPQARLRLNDEVIEFGALHPFKQQAYVRYRGAVHLIPAMALTAVARAPSHFIDGRLIEPDRRLVGLRLPGFTLALKDGSWQRQPPDKNLASDQLSDFVAQWTNARALAVEPAGGRPALATLHLTLVHAGTSETLALDVLAYKPTFTLRRRDEKLEYHFPQEIGKRLLEIGAD
ncbi:MAG: DUF4340 domain-containing protein [Gammaproteobacteria bacterium]|nr:MAG: DUF4340 domain-containing protein [Gammaproteobacteria bacterium]